MQKHMTTIRRVQREDQGQVVSSRKLYCSEVFGCPYLNLSMTIASMLHKMVHTPRHQVDLLDPSRAYLGMAEMSWTWAKLPPDPSRRQIWAECPEGYRRIFFLGLSGVWLITMPL